MLTAMPGWHACRTLLTLKHTQVIKKWLCAAEDLEQRVLGLTAQLAAERLRCAAATGRAEDLLAQAGEREAAAAQLRAALEAARADSHRASVAAAAAEARAEAAVADLASARAAVRAEADAAAKVSARHQLY